MNEEEKAALDLEVKVVDDREILHFFKADSSFIKNMLR